ncbi:MAG: hypothetical protein BZ137_02435 [Methanosphaera sp. rholeuAM130]|nr:MAG: hypothetical protein BZ137_02435 [Methanosphaera sp. rholeuAM130]
MHKCKNCGHMNPDYINVCLECGSDLDTFIAHKFNDEEVEESEDEYELTQEELNKLRMENKLPYEDIPTDDKLPDNIILDDAHEDECDCGIDHELLYPTEEAVVNDDAHYTVNHYKNNYYATNAYEQEVLPVNLNGHKSYYSYIQSLKDEVQQSDMNFITKRLNKKSSIAIFIILLALAAIITPVIAQHEYDSYERTQFNTFSTVALNNELASNQLLAQIAYSNQTPEDKVVQLNNLSTTLDSSIKNTEQFNNFTFNSTRHEFLDLQVEALKIDKKNIDMYQELYQIEADYMNNKIDEAGVQERIGKIPDPSGDLKRMEDIHARLYEIINNDPIIKSDFNNNRVTPIYQALATNANATNNTTTNNTTMANNTTA